MNRLLLVPVAVAAVLGASGGVAVALAHDHQSPGPTSTSGPSTTRTFGPVGYDGVELGMTAPAARAAGARLSRGQGESCAGVRLPGAKSRPHQVDGWLSTDHGVVLLTTTDADAATPEGLRVGLTRAEVAAIYPAAENDPDFWRVAVPGHPGASYWWGYRHGRVGALTVVLDDQDCVN